MTLCAYSETTIRDALDLSRCACSIEDEHRAIDFMAAKCQHVLFSLTLTTCMFLLLLSFLEPNLRYKLYTYHPHVAQQEFDKPHKQVYPRLISYAHNCCQKAKARLCASALQFGFASCIVYDQHNAPISALSPRGKSILNETRGAGYWVWKPLVIWQ